MYLVIIFSILVVQYLLSLTVDLLNVKHADGNVPEEFQQYYDKEKYVKSQDYLKDTTRFQLVESTVSLVVILCFIYWGGFNFVDTIARGFDKGDIFTGLIFAGLFVVFSQVLSLPFSIYHTFVIEEKYGFNRTTKKTFVLDILKGLLLTLLIGGPLFALILWFLKKRVP